MTVDGGLKDLCVHLSNTDPEYSWKVDLKQLYDIEQLIVNGNPSGEYRQNEYNFLNAKYEHLNEDTHDYSQHSNVRDVGSTFHFKTE